LEHTIRARIHDIPVLRKILDGRCLRRQISDISRSPLLDLEYYSAQAGIVFANRKDAASHFIEFGLQQGLSTTVLYQDEWYRYFAGVTDGEPRFLSVLYGDEELTTTSPLFDARRWADERVAAGHERPKDLRSALETFLESAGPDTALPSHPYTVADRLYADARRDAIATSEYNNQKAHHTRTRLSEDWSAQPLPDADNSTALVSVVMPVRNRDQVVARAIASVCAQQHGNWELIVVDDGSTDATALVVARLAEQDSRITLIRAGASGVSAARNKGIAAARGQYVAFLDSDNEWRPGFLRACSSMLDRSPAAVAAHTAVEWTTSEDRPSLYLALVGNRDDLLYGGNFVDLNTLVVRRERLIEAGCFDESLKRWVDYDLVIRLLALGDIAFVPVVGVSYDGSEAPDRISNTEVPGWEQVVLSKYLVDWTKILERPRQPGLMSIVMLTYADWLFTLQATRSILSDSRPARSEFIVFDNGSPRSTTEILSAALSGSTRVHPHRSFRNLNFALGCNAAFARTSGEYVTFINNDVTVHDGWLAELTSAMQTIGNVAAVQSKVINPDGSIQCIGIDTKTIPPSFLNVDRVEATKNPAPVRIDAVSAIAALYSSSAFERVEGFDPIYSNGLEDADLALRMRDSDQGAMYMIPVSVVVHHKSFSPGRFDSMESNVEIFTQRWQTPAKSS
jgi:glycosyltransferase involved in cell wall biosynthesis